MIPQLFRSNNFQIAFCNFVCSSPCMFPSTNPLSAFPKLFWEVVKVKKNETGRLSSNSCVNLRF